MGGPTITMPLLLLTLLSLSTVLVEALKVKVPCIENGKFYRNPNRNPDHVWSQTECAKYYLCIEDEVRKDSVQCLSDNMTPVNKTIACYNNPVNNTMVKK